MLTNTQTDGVSEGQFQHVLDFGEHFVRFVMVNCLRWTSVGRTSLAET